MTIIKKEQKIEELSEFNQKYVISYNGYVQSYINPLLISESGVLESSEQFEKLKAAELTELKIFQKMEITDNETHLIKLDHLYSKNKFSLQKLWNHIEDENRHKFWEAPNCKCPKEDNEAKFPNGNYKISCDCLIHRHRDFTI
jgi:hypothetical protein